MSDPFKYTSPQEERINSELDQRNKRRAKSYQSEHSNKVSLGDYGDLTGITNTTLMEVFATYREHSLLTKQQLQIEDKLLIFEAARVQFMLFNVFQNNLRYDSLHQRITLYGKPIEDLADIRGYVKSREWVGRLPLEAEIWEFARYFKYNPVQDYLNGLRPEFSDPQEYLNTFCEQVLGVSEELDKLFVRRTLIGAVARALNPGCKFDTVLILMGPQGNGKSEFFRELFGEDNYGTVSETSGDKDWRQAMHCVWCSELGEIDGHLRQKNSSGMKSFITDSTDKFRLPYGREITTHRRPGILVGTTNDPTPLIDPTGNRRYWVVKTTKKIDAEQVRVLRDNVWSSALQMYLEDREICYIDYADKETSKLVQDRNSDYREEHPWEETIRLIVDCLDEQGRFEPTAEQANALTRGRFMPLDRFAERWLNTQDILELLGKELDKCSRSETRRVGEAMRTSGHQLLYRTNQGIRQKVWVPVT